MSHKIIIADTHPVFRTGVARILAVEDDFRIIAQCDNCERLLKAVDSSSGAISLFASALHLDLSSFIQKTVISGGHAVAILENNEDPHAYLKQGIAGIIHRNVSNPELIKCLRRVAKGEAFIQHRSSNASTSVANDFVGSRTRDRLTVKELAIIGLLLQGCKNKDIADELNNSEQVIKNYLRGIFDKTGVSDRLELALFAMHHQSLAEAAVDARFRLAKAAVLAKASEQNQFLAFKIKCYSGV